VYSQQLSAASKTVLADKKGTSCVELMVY